MMVRVVKRDRSAKESLPLATSTFTILHEFTGFGTVRPSFGGFGPGLYTIPSRVVPCLSSSHYVVLLGPGAAKE
jgi:hypothetical protein